MRYFDKFHEISYQRVMWIMPAALTVHELEEWNIKDWYTANFVGAPDTPEYAIRAILVMVTAVGMLVTTIACFFRSSSIAAYITLTFFILVAFNNSIQHIYWQLAWGVYAPGVISASALNIPIILLVTLHAYVNNLVKPTFLVVAYATCIPVLVAVMQQGREFPALMLRAHHFGMQLSNIFGYAP